MARRPVFVALGAEERLVKEIAVSFQWSPGFAPVQKKKNIAALHQAAKFHGLHNLLEVSTKSESELGRRLSAFNLTIDTDLGPISIEAAYQGSKRFERGGPYRDIYSLDSRSAKKDERIQDSGQLVGFEFFGQEWPLIPRTAFYDWLYLRALEPHAEWLRRLCDFDGFTDIEFNPRKSINCQARTCALFVALLKLDVLGNALSSQDRFVDIVASDSLYQEHSKELRQRELL